MQAIPFSRAVLKSIVVLLSYINTVSGLCPSGCFCLGGFVTCTDLTSFPAAFPEDTRSISLANMAVPEIPAGIFDKLPVIESIEIYAGSIGKIATGAFDSLSSVDSISLNELKVGIIERHAFHNITNVGTVSFYMSSIDEIKSRAFSDIFALDEIRLFMLNVTKIESFAFSDIDEIFQFSFYTNEIGSLEPYGFYNFKNTHKLSMYLNTFGELGCGSVEELIEETYDHSVYSNTVDCHCSLAWVRNSPSLKKVLYSNWCQVLSDGEKIYWEDMTPGVLECDENVELYQCPTAAAVEAAVAALPPTTSSQRDISSTTQSRSTTSNKIVDTDKHPVSESLSVNMIRSSPYSSTELNVDLYKTGHEKLSPVNTTNPKTQPTTYSTEQRLSSEQTKAGDISMLVSSTILSLTKKSTNVPLYQQPFSTSATVMLQQFSNQSSVLFNVAHNLNLTRSLANSSGLSKLDSVLVNPTSISSEPRSSAQKFKPSTTNLLKTSKLTEPRPVVVSSQSIVSESKPTLTLTPSTSSTRSEVNLSSYAVTSTRLTSHAAASASNVENSKVVKVSNNTANIQAVNETNISASSNRHDPQVVSFTGSGSSSLQLCWWAISLLVLLFSTVLTNVL